jgi:hypothetical protein
MVELFYSLRCRYTIVPFHWTYRLSLGLIESWRNIDDMARFARERRGYGNTDSGFGLDYPTRPDRQGMVRFWRWDWRFKRIKSRKFHFPEADYLATLAARLRVVGKNELAEQIALIMPLPDVQLLPKPDPYDISNYNFRNIQLCTYELRHCLRIILDQRDFDLARERIRGRTPFTLADGSWIEYGEEGRLVLHLHRGHTQETTEDFYLSVLDASEKAYRSWAGKNAKRLGLDPLPKHRRRD